MAAVKTYYRPRSQKKRRLLSSRRRKGPFLSFLPAKFWLFLVSLLFLFSLGSHLYLQHQIHQLETQKKDLLLTKARLSAKISRLKKDPKAYEEIARRKYGLVKDNERLIIFR